MSKETDLVETLSKLEAKDAETLKNDLIQVISAMDAVSLKVNVSKLVESISRAQRLDACPEDVEELKTAELLIPQQEEEGRPETHPPDGGGRADSGPVEGVESLVQHPIEEHGRPAQGDVQRGPGQVVEDTLTDAAEVVKEVGSGNPSALLVLHDPLPGHQWNSLPTHTALRHNPETTELLHPLTEVCRTMPDGLVVPNEPGLSENDLEIGTGQQETDISNDALGVTQDGYSTFPYQPEMLPPHATTNYRPTSKDLPFSTQDCSPSTPLTDMLTTQPHNGEEVHDGAVMAVEDVTEATMQHITGVEDGMETFLGQRSLPFHEQARIASAVCRTVWCTWITGNSKFHGSGSIVTWNGKFYLLTSCHNFLLKKDGGLMKYLEDYYVEKEMKWKCKRAKYLFSTRDLKSTVALPANVVLTNCKDPVLVFDKAHDLLAVEINNPADFPSRLGTEEATDLIPIQPIPLQPSLKITHLLKSAVWLTVAQFPWDESAGHRASCPEFSMGLRRIVNVCQDTQLVYMLDTYRGSSGSPVLLATEGNLVLVAVHRRFSRTDRRFKIGSVVTENFLARL